jgi:mercuric ion binding protein
VKARPHGKAFKNIKLMTGMKKLLLSISIVMLAFGAKAQVMQQKAAWVTISVPQLKCWECKERLEKFLSKETGASDETSVLQVKSNLYNGTVRIQYLPDNISPAYLRTTIANLGFDADTVKATEDGYKTLPPACKRKDEGGGPQKGKPCNIPPDQR